MARKQTPPAGEWPSSANELSRAIKKIEQRLAELHEFNIDEQVHSRDDVGEADLLASRIDHTLDAVFGDDTTLANKFKVHGWDRLPISMYADETSLSEVREHYHERFADVSQRLTMILDRLSDLSDDANAKPQSSQRLQVETDPNTVFIVHGHNDLLKEQVARFLEQVGLQPIILHEQANAGQTIIEKLEHHAMSAGFAVVLMTADDVGASRSDYDVNPQLLQKRARQNVLLELGLFVGLLGRARVACLFDPEVDMPTDFSGVVYTPIDAAGGWKVKLAKELRSAGCQVDLSKIV